MKICSDSLLFGAMTPVVNAVRVLDIGSGTGILSLMLAQKANDEVDCTLNSITAIELTQAAAEEAQQNFINSPWADQLKIIQQDIQQFSQDHKEKNRQAYDTIICNPPFFVNQTKTSSDNPLRHVARHSDTLSFSDLCQSIDCLLTTSGCAYLLLPVIAIAEFCQQASLFGLKLEERIDIAENADSPVKVAMLIFKRGEDRSEGDIKHTRVNKFKQTNIHSDVVRGFLSPFLLRYKS